MYIWNSTNDTVSSAKQITSIAGDGVTITIGGSYAGTVGATKTASVIGHKITMSTDQTANISAGTPIKYTFSSTTYYGIVTAITASLMTIAGPPLGTTGSALTAISYVNSSYLGDAVVSMTLADGGFFADATDSTLLLDDNGWANVNWDMSNAYLVKVRINQITDDSGANQPKINVSIAGNNVLADTSGMSLSLTTKTDTNSIVGINSTYYSITFGQAIELAVQTAGSNKDSQNLSVYLTFVMS